MDNLFDYCEGSGFAFSLNPLWKLGLLLSTWIVCIFAGLWVLIGLSVLLLTLVVATRLLSRFYTQIKWFILVMFPLIFALQILLAQSSTNVANTSIIVLNPSISPEVLLRALQASLRLFCLFGSSVLFVMITNPLKLMQRASRIRIFGRRLPPSLSFLFVYINRSIGLVFSDIERILDAQRARGFSLREASWRHKISGYASLFTPLLTISLERAQKQAMSLEMKGFGAKRK
jgi:energy-coupling factor transport system permease protein